MDAEWDGRLFAASRNYKFALQSRSDTYTGFEEIDGDDDPRPEFPCPFCSEDFDIVGLCCHIDDEHPVEAKNGVCPVCAMRVGMDMVGHITMQHANVFKMQRKKRFRRGGSHSSLSLLRKELREGNLQSILGGPCILPSSNTAPDPLLSSFIYNLPMVDEPEMSQLKNEVEASSAEKCSNESILERNNQISPLSDEDQQEKSRRCEFVQGLLMSTIFRDI